MHTQNLKRWDVSDVFRMIFNSDTPTIFADHFNKASANEKHDWRMMRDGMHQDFLGQSIALGKHQWVQWFLQNDWPVSSRKVSLLRSLVYQDKTFGDKNLGETKNYVHLSDVMRMMSNTQWKRFCSSLFYEETADLIYAIKNSEAQDNSTPLKMSVFVEALKNSPEKHEIFKRCGEPVGRICHQHIYWLDDFERLGWSVESLTSMWQNPLIDCVRKMVSGEEKTTSSAPNIVASVWFNTMLNFPSSQTALANTHTSDPDNRESVWPQLLCCQNVPNVALLITQQLLENVQWTTQRMEDLQHTICVCEDSVGATPSSEAVRAFLSKQIITASLKNSVKSVISSEKKSFKKM